MPPCKYAIVCVCLIYRGVIRLRMRMFDINHRVLSFLFLFVLFCFVLVSFLYLFLFFFPACRLYAPGVAYA